MGEENESEEESENENQNKIKKMKWTTFKIVMHFLQSTEKSVNPNLSI